MYRVGVIGSQQTVQRILEASVDCREWMELVPYPYEDPEDVRKALEEEKHTVDTWLFSGPIPYLVAKEVLGPEEDLVYVPVLDAGLYKAMVNIIYEQGKIVDKISIDTPGDMYPIDKVMNQLIKAPRDIFVKPFYVNGDVEELIEYHYDLWKQGKTEAAITFIPSVYRKLRQLGVPAGGLTVGFLEVQQALQMLAEKLRATFYMDRQTGVVLFEIHQYDQLALKSQTPYVLQQLELRVKDALLQLSVQLGGSLSERGNGRYVIFSSRGAIKRELKQIHHMVEKISLEIDSPFSVGVGFGETVVSAEINAQYALQQSREKSKALMIVLDNGMVIESTGEEKGLTYSARVNDQALMEKLKQGNISGKTYNKIYALVRSMGWREFTSKDLATNLQMSDRNAQRIVAQLCEVGLAEIVGEESNHSRGRPSKLYRLVEMDQAVMTT